MGQAKLRGSLESRHAQAVAAARAAFPPVVRCNACGLDIEAIEPMDVRGMPGMRLAGAAVCSGCSQTTWILDGTPEALERMQDFMNAEYGQEGKMGFVEKPLSKT